MERIKLIWDFRGPMAAKTAEHHVIHLREFAQMEGLHLEPIEFAVQGEMAAMAYLVCTREQMIPLRDRLRPHRGELYSDMA